MPAEINFHVTRFNPETDQAPYVQIYPVPVRERADRARTACTTSRQLDASLAWRYSWPPCGILRLSAACC